MRIALYSLDNIKHTQQNNKIIYTAFNNNYYYAIKT